MKIKFKGYKTIYTFKHHENLEFISDILLSKGLKPLESDKNKFKFRPRFFNFLLYTDFFWTNNITVEKKVSPLDSKEHLEGTTILKYTANYWLFTILISTNIYLGFMFTPLLYAISILLVQIVLVIMIQINHYQVIKKLIRNQKFDINSLNKNK